jgi:hypothetical protein
VGAAVRGAGAHARVGGLNAHTLRYELRDATGTADRLLPKTVTGDSNRR